MMRRLSCLLLACLALAGAAPLPAQSTPEGPLWPAVAHLFQRPVWRNATWGVLVVSLETGDTLISWNAERPFVPASNAKLFTTAAALHYLGADYRFVTALLADGPLRGGTLLGDLVLYGTGDPTFAPDTASLASFADSVVLRGIRRVRGDLVGDASFLGAELTGPGWSPDNLDEPFASPPSALGAAENRVKLMVFPGSRIGDIASVRVEPANDYFRIISRVRTVARGRTRIQVQHQPNGIVELSGNLRVTSYGWSTYLVVRQPAIFAAGLLRQLLEARGVAIDGTTRAVTDDDPDRTQAMLRHGIHGTDPLAGALAVRRSMPLDELVTFINHRSHNLSAELLLRSIGRVAGNAGTWASGARLVRQYLVSQVGLSPDEVQVVDGSGLSLLDRATPRALVRLLTYMGQAPEGQVFIQSLPLVGMGMHERMTTTAAVGRLRAKTGTLNTVSALSGYVTTEGGEALVFSVIVNDAPSIRRARVVQDSLGAFLAGLDRGQTAVPLRAGGN